MHVQTLRFSYVTIGRILLHEFELYEPYCLPGVKLFEIDLFETTLTAVQTLGSSDYLDEQ